MIVAIAVGPPLVLAATYYESRDSVEFHSTEAGIWFTVHLRAEGPLTTYKDVTLLSVQINAYTPRDTEWVQLSIWGQSTLWEIKMVRQVNYHAQEIAGDIWQGKPEDGRIVFTQYGLQNLTGHLVWYGQNIILAPGNDASVTVLPKEADDSWTAGRLGLVALVISGSLFAVPVSVRELRDLYRDGRA